MTLSWTLAFAEYASGCSRIMAACTDVSSARAPSSEAPGARRPKSSVIRWTRLVTIVAPEVMRAGHDVRDDLGVGRIGAPMARGTPTTVAVRGPRRMVLPITVGSLLSEVVQNR